MAAGAGAGVAAGTGASAVSGALGGRFVRPSSGTTNSPPLACSVTAVASIRATRQHVHQVADAGARRRRGALVAQERGPALLAAHDDPADQDEIRVAAAAPLACGSASGRRLALNSGRASMVGEGLGRAAAHRPAGGARRDGAPQARRLDRHRVERRHRLVENGAAEQQRGIPNSTPGPAASSRAHPAIGTHRPAHVEIGRIAEHAIRLPTFRCVQVDAAEER